MSDEFFKGEVSHKVAMDVRDLSRAVCSLRITDPQHFSENDRWDIETSIMLLSALHQRIRNADAAISPEGRNQGAWNNDCYRASQGG